MREIKFRAWYGGQIVEVGQLDFFTDGQITVNDELVGAKLMQFTGLKDKNGKEIYEGDVVNTQQLIGTVKWSEEHGKWEVEYIGDSRKFALYTQNRDTEVIGNIYENP